MQVLRAICILLLAGLIAMSGCVSDKTEEQSQVSDQTTEQTTVQVTTSPQPTVQTTIRVLVPSETVVTSTEPSAGAFSGYTNADYGFKIQYPSGWAKNEDIPESDKYINVIFSPVDLAMSPDYIFTVHVEAAPMGLDFEQYTEFYIGSLEQEYNTSKYGFKVAESENTTLAGLGAHRITYTLDESGKYGKITDIWTLKDDKVYAVTFISDEERYPLFLNTSEKMIDSFQIT